MCVCARACAGYTRFEIVYNQLAGATSLKLMYSKGAGSNAYTDMPWQAVLPIAGGVPVPIALSVNGVPAQYNCNAGGTTQSLDVTTRAYAPANIVATPYEPTQVLLPGKRCVFVYSTYYTPKLVAVGTASNGFSPASQKGAAVTPMTLWGSFLTSDVALISVTVGGAACANATLNTTVPSNTSVTCTPPYLPAGSWPVAMKVASLGTARLPLLASGTGAAPLVMYRVKQDALTAAAPPPAGTTSYARGSIQGGFLWRLQGVGLVGGINSSALQLASTVKVTAQVALTGNPLAFAAVPLAMSSATNSTAALSVGRMPSQTKLNPASDVWTLTVNLDVRNTSDTLASADAAYSADGTLRLDLAADRTPRIAAGSVDAAALASAGTLAFRWSIGGLSLIHI